MSMKVLKSAALNNGDKPFDFVEKSLLPAIVSSVTPATPSFDLNKFVVKSQMSGISDTIANKGWLVPFQGSVVIDAPVLEQGENLIKSWATDEELKKKSVIQAKPSHRKGTNKKRKIKNSNASYKKSADKPARIETPTLVTVAPVSAPKTTVIGGRKDISELRAKLEARVLASMDARSEDTSVEGSDGKLRNEATIMIREDMSSDQTMTYQMKDMRKDSPTKGDMITSTASAGYYNFIFNERDAPPATNVAYRSGKLARVVSKDELGNNTIVVAPTVTPKSLAYARDKKITSKLASQASRGNVSYALVDKLVDKAFNTDTPSANDLPTTDTSGAYDYEHHHYVTHDSAGTMVTSSDGGLAPWEDKSNDELKTIRALEASTRITPIDTVFLVPEQHLSGRITDRQLASLPEVYDIKSIIAYKRAEKLQREEYKAAWKEEVENTWYGWSYDANHDDALKEHKALGGGVSTTLRGIKDLFKGSSDISLDYLKAYLSTRETTCASVPSCREAKRLQAWFDRDQEKNFIGARYGSECNPVDNAHFVSKHFKILSLASKYPLPTQKFSDDFGYGERLVSQEDAPDGYKFEPIPDLVLRDFSKVPRKSSTKYPVFSGLSAKEKLAVSLCSNSTIRDVVLAKDIVSRDITLRKAVTNVTKAGFNELVGKFDFTGRIAVLK